MIGWLAVGLLVGFAAGFAAAWFSLRRPGAAAGPSLAPESRLAEPLVGSDPTDEEMSQALDATKGLLDELEGRYRGRTAAEDDDQPRPRRRSRPRKRE